MSHDSEKLLRTLISNMLLRGAFTMLSFIQGVNVLCCIHAVIFQNPMKQDEQNNLQEM